MDKKLILTTTIIAAAIVGGLFFVQTKSPKSPAPAAQTTTPTQSQPDTDRFSYKGSNGLDALSLLKQNAATEQDSSGLVTSINNRKADPAKREFWGFYVNGEMSQVGPADYKTKNEDIVEWRIEKY